MKLWKKAIFAATLTGLAVVAPISPQVQPVAHAQTVSIDGRTLQNVATVVRNGNTLVAMRPIFEALGASVAWDGANQRITAQSTNAEVIMQIGSSLASVNGSSKSLAQAPVLYLGNTMVPLRFVSEALGAQVNYDAATRRISIVTPQVAPESSPGQSVPVDTTPPVAPQEQEPVEEPTEVPVEEPVEEIDQDEDAASTRRGNGISISLTKRIYAPTEPFELSFTAPAGLDYNTRADLIPADIKAGQPDLDANLRITYQTLKSKRRGTLGFKAPQEEGQYLLRVNGKNTQYTSIPFEVRAITPTVSPQFEMEKDVYIPGEPISIRFEAPAFYSYNANLSLVASDIPVENTHPNRITYQNIKGKTQGTLEFKAPNTLGDYELRFDDNYGHIIPALAFSVQATSDTMQPTVQISGTHFNEGDEIRVDFTSFSFYAYNARVALIPAEYQDESIKILNPYVVTYQTLKNKTRGTLTFKAPKDDGVYLFILDDNQGNIVARTAEFAVGNAVVQDDNQRDRGRRNRGNRGNRNQRDRRDNSRNQSRDRNRAQEVGDDVADEAQEGIADKIKKGLGKIFK